MSKELLFSLTAKDFEWDYVRGSGKGGQKKNKTSSAVRCRHLASGAIGYAEDERSQYKNRRLAFKRMADSPQFTRWVRIEAAKYRGGFRELLDKIDRGLLDPTTTKIEVRDETGKWVPL